MNPAPSIRRDILPERASLPAAPMVQVPTVPGLHIPGLAGFIPPSSPSASARSGTPKSANSGRVRGPKSAKTAYGAALGALSGTGQLPGGAIGAGSPFINGGVGVTRKKGGVKRGRPASGAATDDGREAKRFKGSSREGVSREVVGARMPTVGAGNVSSPRSPTSSSRSRTKKVNMNKLGEKGSNLISAASSESPRSRMRRTPGQKVILDYHPSSCFVVDDLAVTDNVRTSTFHKRVFGQEVQCIMHVFGEVRFAAREVVEMVEDTVREAVRKAAFAAADCAVEEAIMRDAAPPVSDGCRLVSLQSVLAIVEKNRRIYNRLNVVLRQIAGEKPGIIPKDIASCRTNVLTTPMEAIRELAIFEEEKESSETSKHDFLSAQANDVASVCSFQFSRFLLRQPMSRQQLAEFRFCRMVSFVRSESRSRSPTLAKQPRIKLFREWLDLSAKNGILIQEDALYALGHIAWEITGLITQCALLYRHFDDLARGLGDPRAHGWKMSRHILAALRHGVATAFTIPIADYQLRELLYEEVEKAGSISPLRAQSRWRGYGKGSSPCLLPSHIREALRRLGRAPDQLWGVPTGEGGSLFAKFLRS